MIKEIFILGENQIIIIIFFSTGNEPKFNLRLIFFFFENVHLEIEFKVFIKRLTVWSSAKKL